ncbi:hypothetical protein N0V91_003223 [Didymella pomorum]|uniref:Uncharacterized protein n=1 Tax=Didymella pomorum TaxID=749634 RepID=A0A9W8ZI31_9PLEO|nr:hypothetical protein N0V91_003223 [Didymella pomorum]
MAPARPKMSFDYDEHDSVNGPKLAEVDVAPPPPPKDLPRRDANELMHSKSIPLAHTFIGPETEEKPPPLPVRPKRSDSGTAVASNDIRLEASRPMGFNEIAVIRSYKDRMACCYKSNGR